MQEILKKDRDFQKVYKRKNVTGNRVFTMFLNKNNFPYSRIGFVITKKFGNAVTRNKFKRRLRMILRDYNLKPGYDIVLILKKDKSYIDYSELKRSFEHVLRKKGLIWIE